MDIESWSDCETEESETSAVDHAVMVRQLQRGTHVLSALSLCPELPSPFSKAIAQSYVSVAPGEVMGEIRFNFAARAGGGWACGALGLGQRSLLPHLT